MKIMKITNNKSSISFERKNDKHFIGNEPKAHDHEPIFIGKESTSHNGKPIFISNEEMFEAERSSRLKQVNDFYKNRYAIDNKTLTVGKLKDKILLDKLIKLKDRLIKTAKNGDMRFRFIDTEKGVEFSASRLVDIAPGKAPGLQMYVSFSETIIKPGDSILKLINTAIKKGK